MKIDGACHCGHVTYEATIDPARVGICHCTDCQTLTGAAYRVTVTTERENLTLAGGAPKVYEKISERGRKRLQYFCPECGSPILVTGEGDDAATWGIRWGSIRQRRELAPRRQMWTSSALPWVDHVGELPGAPGE